MVPSAELVESRTEQKRVYSQCDTWWWGHGSLSWVGYQIPSVYLWSDGEECVQLLYANNMNGRCVCVYFSGRRKTLFLSQHLDLDFLNCTPAFSTSGPSHYLSYVFFTFIPFPRLIVLCSDGSISFVIHHQTINANESVKRVHVSVPPHLRVGVPV